MVECLNDGGDCVGGVCEQLEECTGVAGDGICQSECYTALCPYDGQDCAGGADEFVSTFSLYVVVV